MALVTLRRPLHPYNELIKYNIYSGAFSSFIQHYPKAQLIAAFEKALMNSNESWAFRFFHHRCVTPFDRDGSGNNLLMIVANYRTERLFEEVCSRMPRSLINEVNFKGETALYRAVQKGNWYAALLLLKAGACMTDLNLQPKPSKMFFLSLFKGSLLLPTDDLAKKLLTLGLISPTDKDEDGNSLLILALKAEKRGLFFKILKEISGNFIDQKNKDGETALEIALRLKDWECVYTLRNQVAFLAKTPQKPVKSKTQIRPCCSLEKRRQDAIFNGKEIDLDWNFEELYGIACQNPQLKEVLRLKRLIAIQHAGIVWGLRGQFCFEGFKLSYEKLPRRAAISIFLASAEGFSSLEALQSIKTLASLEPRMRVQKIIKRNYDLVVAERDQECLCYLMHRRSVYACTVKQNQRSIMHYQHEKGILEEDLLEVLEDPYRINEDRFSWKEEVLNKEGRVVSPVWSALELVFWVLHYHGPMVRGEGRLAVKEQANQQCQNYSNYLKRKVLGFEPLPIETVKAIYKKDPTIIDWDIFCRNRFQDFLK